MYYPDGRVELEVWLKDGKFYERENGKYNYKCNRKHTFRRWCMSDALEPIQIHIGYTFSLIHKHIISDILRK